MERQNRSLFQRLIAAAVSASMLASLAACAKPPAETAAPKEPVTAEKAITELHRQSEALGFDNALEELEEKNTATIGGDTYIRLQQYYKGIPVYGKTIVYAANEDGQMTSVTGNVQDIDPDIDLTPTITPAQAQESIRTYAAEVLELENANISYSEPTACIYNGNKLAYLYTVTMGGNYFAAHEVLVDSHDASILEWNPYAASFDTNQDVLEAADVACESDNSNNFRLADTHRNHSVYYLDLATTIQYPTLEAVVGNDDFLATAVPDQTASGETYALADLAQISDFYADVLGRQSYDNQGGTVYLFSCDADLLADNGKSLAYPEYGVIMLGEPVSMFSEPLGKAMDLVAHEYAHLVFQTEVGLSTGLDVTSVNEGIADIFGNLIELYVNGEQDTSWPLAEDAGYVKYYMADPMTMASYGNEEHDNAHILSHSAYLMWNGIDGTESKRLSEQQLAELWYRAVLMMPSDCDFILCRQLVEVAAQSMENLTDEQRACVREAFDRVGISTVSEDTEADYQLDVNGTLSVYDENRAYYSGYTLSINGNPMRLPVGDRKPEIGFYYNKTVKVDSAEPYQIDLPAGLYLFKISDAYSPVTYSFSVQVGPGYASNIDLITAYEEPLVVVIPTTNEVISEFTYKADGTLSSITHHDYNEEGLLQSSTSWSLSDDGHYAYWYTDSTTSFQYDPAGNPIQTIIFSNNHDVTTNSEYDDSGNLLLTHNLQSGIKREYRYDDAGNLTWVCGKDADGNILDAAEHFYDANGNQIRSVDYWYSSGEIVYADVYVSEYDDQGHLISTKSEESDDDWTVYTYDANWNLIRKESRYGDMAFNMTYEYDEQNRLVYTEETDSWESRSGTTYEYDSSGNIVSKTFLDGSKIVYVYDRITASEPIGGWKDAYRSYIRNLDNIPDETRFYLADMNSDGIPELFIDFVIYADGAILCTFDGTSVISEPLSRGRISFIPGTGSFHHYWSFQGMYSDTIYRIENGSFETVAVGFWTDMEPDSHTWNDEPVTPEAYTQNLTDAFDDSAAVPMGHLPADMTIDSVVGPNEYSFAQILSILS